MPDAALTISNLFIHIPSEVWITGTPPSLFRGCCPADELPVAHGSAKSAPSRQIHVQMNHHLRRSRGSWTRMPPAPSCPCSWRWGSAGAAPPSPPPFLVPAPAIAALTFLCVRKATSDASSHSIHRILMLSQNSFWSRKHPNGHNARGKQCTAGFRHMWSSGGWATMFDRMTVGPLCSKRCYLECMGCCLEAGVLKLGPKPAEPEAARQAPPATIEFEAPCHATWIRSSDGRGLAGCFACRLRIFVWSRQLPAPPLVYLRTGA